MSLLCRILGHKWERSVIVGYRDEVVTKYPSGVSGYGVSHSEQFVESAPIKMKETIKYCTRCKEQNPNYKPFN